MANLSVLKSVRQIHRRTEMIMLGKICRREDSGSIQALINAGFETGCHQITEKMAEDLSSKHGGTTHLFCQTSADCVQQNFWH